MFFKAIITLLWVLIPIRFVYAVPIVYPLDVTVQSNVTIDPIDVTVQSSNLVYPVNVTVYPVGSLTLTAPSGSISDTTPSYSWDAVDGSTWYYLWVDSASGNVIKKWYSSVAAGCSSGTGTCSVTPSTTLSSGNHTWWIQTYSSAGYGAWSNSLHFSVSSNNPPEKTTLLSPSGITMDTTPSYSWDAVSDSTWYYLWVDSTSGNTIKKWYSSAVAGCSSGTGTCSVTPSTTLSSGNHTWWVQTYNTAGNGAWSNPLNFSISSNSPPEKTTLLSPSGIMTDTTPSYSWDAVSNSTWYYLWVNDASGNVIKKWYTASALGCASGEQTCSITPTTVLSTGNHTWWVQTYNTAGNGAWSNPLNFSVSSNTLGKTTLLSPSGITTETTPSYSWDAVSNSTWYYLWVNDASGNIIKKWYTASALGCASGEQTCSITPTAVLSTGDYTWWVQTYNAAENGAWSNGLNFTIH